ncbi:hypothetical protein DVK85_08010 [Flavobacterium arcticum]|uniref:YtxH domain-containing protein n=1 Tax=Flavobacterium arcticum TaxID=1784713 RepID=A0A345HC75_9FLAO|nr:hypothetical protein [Flavobacterium arcticum]AXG74185.1 hypothetical protein DVK85_08010 [Flavobacterium arcticum]KAF2508226.1 hypothetical protein E0W72_11285 [Flavobacterium arcticum]
MKKVVLSMALVAMMSVSFVSCKEKANEAETEMEAAADDATEAVEETAEDATEAVEETADEAGAKMDSIHEEVTTEEHAH